MLGLIVQLAIVGLWLAIIVIHTRRLLRMSHIESLATWGAPQFRHKLTRVWWWLGREEYWRAVQIDGLRCMQVTVMLFLLAWGMYV